MTTDRTWENHEYKTPDGKWYVTIYRRGWGAVAKFSMFNGFYEKYVSMWEWEFPKGTACYTPTPILADMIEDRLGDNEFSRMLRDLVEQ